MISYKSGGYITRLLCLGNLDTINLHYCLFLNKEEGFWYQIFLQKVNQKKSKYVRWWDMLINLVGGLLSQCMCVYTYICIYNHWRRQWHPIPVLLPGNPMDRGAWWAAVHGVTKSWTQLSDFTFTFPFHALEKEMATHSNVHAWRIPGMAEPGGLLSMGSHRVGHNWSNLAAAAYIIITLYTLTILQFYLSII